MPKRTNNAAGPTRKSARLERRRHEKHINTCPCLQKGIVGLTANAEKKFPASRCSPGLDLQKEIAEIRAYPIVLLDNKHKYLERFNIRRVNIRRRELPVLAPEQSNTIVIKSKNLHYSVDGSSKSTAEEIYFPPPITPEYESPLEPCDMDIDSSPSVITSDARNGEDTCATIMSSDSDTDSLGTVHRRTISTIHYAVKQQQGWQTEGLRSKHTNKTTHPVIEDAFFIPRHPNSDVHIPTNTRYTIFALADGHGGAQAAKYFCRHVPRKIREIVNSKDKWDFRDVSDQRIFREKIKAIHKALDQRFLTLQKRKFVDWQRRGCPEPIPEDQGSTLNLVILYNGVAIISNLGDSKTIICRTAQQRRNSKIKLRLNLTFQTVDHSPGHPDKAYHIHNNGGVFRRVEDEKIIKPKIQPPPTPSSFSSGCMQTSYSKFYSSLLKARVCRPEGFQNCYGLVNNASVNIGDAMGDLYFKLDPPLFQCDPDVDFVELETGVEYVGILAPDGLWDHMTVRMPEFVRKTAKYLEERRMWDEFEYARKAIELDNSSKFNKRNKCNGHNKKDKNNNKIVVDDDHQDMDERSKDSIPVCRMNKTKTIANGTTSVTPVTSSRILSTTSLKELAKVLCDREGDALGIFERDQGRYDDCTVIAFTVKFEED